MMRFTIGLILLAFTAVVGGYQLFSNYELIQVRERGVQDLSRKLDQNQRLIGRLQKVREQTMRRGQDQKFTIERMLGIGEPGLGFTFVGQPQKAGGSNAFYYHTYRISGPATFDEAYELLKKLAKRPGFSVYKFCFGCTRKPRGSPKNTNMVQIEGYLYVYDPKTL
jgi:hypothetical protein